MMTCGNTATSLVVSGARPGDNVRLRLFVQPVHDQEEAIRRSGPGREPAAAAERPDPEPGRDREGVAAAGAGRLQAIADARAKMAGAATPAEKIAAANAESSALARLLVVVENYPQPQVERDVRAPHGRARGHREPAVDRAHALQRARAGVQHAAAAVPVERHGAPSSASRSTRTSTRPPAPSACPRWTSGSSHV